MNETKARKPVPLYTSRGDCNAYLLYPLLYNLDGDWIGFVLSSKDVYSVYGDYVGYLSNDFRILRKRVIDQSKPKLVCPPKQPNIRMPALTPLAPLMCEVTYDMIDVLLEDPDLLPTLDAGEFKPDLE